MAYDPPTTTYGGAALPPLDADVTLQAIAADGCDGTLIQGQGATVSGTVATSDETDPSVAGSRIGVDPGLPTVQLYAAGQCGRQLRRFDRPRHGDADRHGPDAERRGTL